MTTNINLFSQNTETNISEKIIAKIKNSEWEDIFNGFCNVKDNLMILEYVYFKHIGSKETYDAISNYIINRINNILSIHEGFVVHINMKHLTIKDVDKHKNFIQDISIFFKETYPNKMIKCFIYNAPFVFSQILNIVSLFIDKETLQKIELVSMK